MSLSAGVVIDRLPRRLWRPANLYLNRLHFCHGHEGRRTVEWDGRELAHGRRIWDDTPEGAADADPHDAG